MNGLASRGTAKIDDFYGNGFSAITFDSNFVRFYFYRHRAPLVKTCRMSYNLILKNELNPLTIGQGRDLTGKGRVAYQSIRIVKPNTSNVFLLL